MIHCRLEDLYKPKFALLWMLLSFKAGYLNAAGFMATGKFVSHVTGFGTSMGIAFANKEYAFGLELLVIPIAFILGSSVPAFMLEDQHGPKEEPKFYQVQFLITFSLLVLFVFGTKGIFGDFSTPGEDFHDIVVAGILCLICGMKNGLTTWATFGKIRTTHLTGLSTDIGLHLPKMLKRDWISRFPERRRTNTVRILTFVSFTSGSLIAAFIFPSDGYWGLLFPLILSIFLSGLSYFNYQHHTHASIKEHTT